MRLTLRLTLRLSWLWLDSLACIPFGHASSRACVAFSYGVGIHEDVDGDAMGVSLASITPDLWPASRSSPALQPLPPAMVIGIGAPPTPSLHTSEGVLTCTQGPPASRSRSTSRTPTHPPQLVSSSLGHVTGHPNPNIGHVGHSIHGHLTTSTVTSC